MFNNLLSFKGRIRRREYALTYLGYFILSILLEVLILIAGDESNIEVVFLLPAYYIMLAQGAKRCHDRGNSGWYQIIPFYVFWMIFAEGEADPNRYGPSPKRQSHDYSSFERERVLDAQELNRSDQYV